MFAKADCCGWNILAHFDNRKVSFVCSAMHYYYYFFFAFCFLVPSNSIFCIMLLFILFGLMLMTFTENANRGVNRICGWVFVLENEKINTVLFFVPFIDWLIFDRCFFHQGEIVFSTKCFYKMKIAVWIETETKIWNLIYRKSMFWIFESDPYNHWIDHLWNILVTQHFSSMAVSLDDLDFDPIYPSRSSQMYHSSWVNALCTLRLPSIE